MANTKVAVCVKTVNITPKESTVTNANLASIDLGINNGMKLTCANVSIYNTFENHFSFISFKSWNGNFIHFYFIWFQAVIATILSLPVIALKDPAAANVEKNSHLQIVTNVVSGTTVTRIVNLASVTSMVP